MRRICWKLLKYLLFSIIFLGKPTPVVTWLVNGKETAGRLEETGLTIVVNKLTVPQLKREHLNTTYKCRASNTNLMPPLEKSVLLNVYCEYKPFSFSTFHKNLSEKALHATITLLK